MDFCNHTKLNQEFCQLIVSQILTCGATTYLCMWLKANSPVIKIMLAIVFISAKYQSEEYESEDGVFSLVSGYIGNFFTLCDC